MAGPPIGNRRKAEVLAEEREDMILESAATALVCVPE
jgi:hypothetical protein